MLFYNVFERKNYTLNTDFIIKKVIFIYNYLFEARGSKENKVFSKIMLFRDNLFPREMPVHYFVTLAKYYNVSLDYLAGLIDTPKKLK